MINYYLVDGYSEALCNNCKVDLSSTGHDVKFEMPAPGESCESCGYEKTPLKKFREEPQGRKVSSSRR